MKTLVTKHATQARKCRIRGPLALEWVSRRFVLGMVGMEQAYNRSTHQNFGYSCPLASLDVVVGKWSRKPHHRPIPLTETTLLAKSLTLDKTLAQAMAMWLLDPIRLSLLGCPLELQENVRGALLLEMMMNTKLPTLRTPLAMADAPLDTRLLRALVVALPVVSPLPEPELDVALEGVPLTRLAVSSLGATELARLATEALLEKLDLEVTRARGGMALVVAPPLYVVVNSKTAAKRTGSVKESPPTTLSTLVYTPRVH